jgi:hypothetical protein
MGYIISKSVTPLFIFNFTNGALILWDSTTPLDLTNTKNFIVDQCSILYNNATTPLTFTASPEIELIDSGSGNIIQYAFHQGGTTLNPNDSIRLSGGNKSNQNVDTYNIASGLQLSLSTAISGGDGDLVVFLWGTYV